MHSLVISRTHIYFWFLVYDVKLVLSYFRIFPTSLLSTQLQVALFSRLSALHLAGTQLYLLISAQTLAHNRTGSTKCRLLQHHVRVYPNICEVHKLSKHLSGQQCSQYNKACQFIDSWVYHSLNAINRGTWSDLCPNGNSEIISSQTAEVITSCVRTTNLALP